jgi:hypothetical protein
MLASPAVGPAAPDFFLSWISFHAAPPMAVSVIPDQRKALSDILYDVSIHDLDVVDVKSLLSRTRPDSSEHC